MHLTVTVVEIVTETHASGFSDEWGGEQSNLCNKQVNSTPPKQFRVQP